MNQEAFDKICRLFQESQISYQVYSHEICRTSQESTKVRRDLGLPEAIGAKALLCKLTLKSGPIFATLVLPGNHVLDKVKLKQSIPDLKQFRFASQEELLDLAGGGPWLYASFWAANFFTNSTSLYFCSSS